MTRGQIKRLYENYSCKEAAKLAGVSVPTFLKMVDRVGVQRKGSGRPYKKESETANKRLYVSAGMSDLIIDGKRNTVKTFGFFMFILMDSILAANNWDGETNTHIYNQFRGASRDENISHLEGLKECGVIEKYSIDSSGFLSVTIKDRKRFVLTEQEYLKELELQEQIG